MDFSVVFTKSSHFTGTSMPKTSSKVNRAVEKHGSHPSHSAEPARSQGGEVLVESEQEKDSPHSPPFSSLPSTMPPETSAGKP